MDIISKEAMNQIPHLVTVSDDMMLNYYEGNRMPRFLLGWNAVDYGFLKGNLVLVSGYPNHGKGTFVRQTALQMNILHNTKWCFYAPEDMPEEYFYADLIHAYTGMSTEKHHRNFIGKDEYLSAFQFIKDRIRILDIVDEEPSMDLLLSTFERMIQEHGCNGFVIDPFNNLSDLNNSERDDKIIRSVCLKARQFAVKHQVFLIIVLHPKGASGVKSGDDLRIPTYNELHYGSEWAKIADDIMFFHHPSFNTDKQNTKRILSFGKIKKGKISGPRTDYVMNWNYEQNRILDEYIKSCLPEISTTPKPIVKNISTCPAFTGELDLSIKPEIF